MTPGTGDAHPVRIARKARGWELKDLASRAERSISLLSMIEKGYVPKLGTRKAIARALELDVDVCFPDQDNTEESE